MDSSPHVLIQTRLPTPLRVYLKAYAKQRGISMEKSCEHILTLFLQQQPWLQGLRWRIPLSNRTDAGEQYGWKQLNVVVGSELAGRVDGMAKQLSLSRAAIVYSAFYWFARYIAPVHTSQDIE